MATQFLKLLIFLLNLKVSVHNEICVCDPFGFKLSTSILSAPKLRKLSQSEQLDF